jgi:hypothetical protein
MCSGELESLDLFFMWQMIEAAHQDTTTCSLHLDLFFFFIIIYSEKKYNECYVSICSASYDCSIATCSLLSSAAKARNLRREDKN